MNKQEWACLYSAKGYKVIPLAPNKKTPMESFGTVADYPYKTPGDIKKIWDKNPNANIGVVCDDIFCIDLDNKHKGVNGIQSLSKFDSEIDSNWICKTPNDGIHLYFTGNADSNIGVVPGVDIIAKNRFIVMPPSTIDGKDYTWNDEKEVSRAKSKPVNADHHVKALLYLKGKDDKKMQTETEEPKTIEQGSRVNTLVSLCSQMVNAHMDLNAIKQAIIYENQNSCIPPLTQKELEKEVFPCLKRFDSVPRKKKTSRNFKKVKPINGKELEKMDTKPIEYLVNDLIPSVGVGIISALPKSFKSYMALDLALSVAEGQPFLGYETTKSNVLYLDLESSPRRSQERIKQIGKPFSEGFNVLTAKDEIPVLGSGFTEVMDDLIKEMNIKLLIVDVFARIKGFSMSRNEYQNDYNQMKELTQLSIENEMFIMLIHHNRKMKSTDPFEQMSGSNGLFGSLDFAMNIQKERGASDGIINITGRDIEEKELFASFDKKMMRWINKGSKEEYLEQIQKERFLNSDTTQALLQLLDKYNGQIEMNAQKIIDQSNECDKSISIDSGSFGQFLNQNKYLFDSEYNIKVEQGRNHTGRYWKIYKEHEQLN